MCTLKMFEYGFMKAKLIIIIEAYFLLPGNFRFYLLTPNENFPFWQNPGKRTETRLWELTGIVWLPCKLVIAAWASGCEPNFTNAQPVIR